MLPKSPAKVLIYTQAYNAAKTLKMAMDSVLHQTYPHFIYIVMDNGSADKATTDIVRDYMAQDPRVYLLHFDKNSTNFLYNCNFVFQQIDEEYDYFAILDADDEYAPDFLEKSIAFAEANYLDIVCCGSNFVDATCGKIVGHRNMFSNLFLDNPITFDRYFPNYHQFLRTAWGKLFRSSLINSLDLKSLSEIGMINGSDTLLSTTAFQNASRIGIMQDILHNYYLYPKSVYRTWLPKRVVSNNILLEKARELLISKCGSVSSHNEGFLMLVYMNALKDTLNVLLNARIPTQEKLAGIIDMFTHEYAGQLMAREHFGLGLGSVSELSAQRRELFSVAASWLLSLDEVPDQFIEGYCDVGERLSAATDDAGKWLFFQKLRLRFLLEENRKDEARLRLSELIELIPNDPEMAEFQRLL